MKFFDEVVRYLKQPDKSFVYISKENKNIKQLNYYIQASMDIDKMSSRVYGAHPISLHKIEDEISGVWFDKGSTGEEHIRLFLNLTKNAFIKEVSE